MSDIMNKQGRKVRRKAESGWQVEHARAGWDGMGRGKETVGRAGGGGRADECGKEWEDE